MDTFELQRAESVQGDLSSCQLGVGFDVQKMLVRSSAIDVKKAELVDDPVSDRDSMVYKLERLDQSKLEEDRIKVRGVFRASIGPLEASVEGGFEHATENSKGKSFLRFTIGIVQLVRGLKSFSIGLGDGVDFDDRDFRDKYGTGYVSSISYGGYMEARMEVNENTSKSLNVFDIKGKVTSGIVTVEASIKAQIELASSGREVEITISQRGGEAWSLELSPTVDSLARLVTEFAKQVRSTKVEDLVPVAITISKYESAPRIAQLAQLKRYSSALPVDIISEEVLLLENVLAILRGFGSAQVYIASQLHVQKATLNPSAFRNLLAAYRELYKGKARVTKELVRASLDTGRLTRELVKSLPQAFEVMTIYDFG
uniref:Uncharacterized protein n=1 Tax=Rhodosorus marinus TaxID=101924 RepID=A0A7S3A8A2_9RHOD|mmetsp:Transcript_5706/g.24091  ORF Transcript_5706/g.24091 Transcript_5706/m.24091 type:complete len:371 (+) Transcript_5706:80-1192(+)